MRPLEIAIIVILLPYVLHLLSISRGETLWFAVWPFIAACVAIFHTATEGYRWQMFPAYGLIIVFISYECARWFFSFRTPFFLGYFLGMSALCVEFVAIALSTALPVFNLPMPGGPYKVGTQIRHIVDESRMDPLSDRAGDVREMMIQIWYPAEASAKGPIAPYRDRRTTTFKDSRFALVETHSVLEAQLSRSHGQYPLLLYAPSWNGIRTENTFQIEELASHGYVVVGMDHPYISDVTVFPDGRIVRGKLVGGEDYTSSAALDAFVRLADQQVDIRTKDASFVLDTLERLNASDPRGLLTGHLDLSRVGMFGFSFGGTTAAQSCWADRRFKAGLDMGGMIAGEAAERGTSAPFFFMSEGMYENAPYTIEANLSGVDDRKRREIEFSRKQVSQMQRSLSEFGGYWMSIDRIGHLSFSDSPFGSPLRNCCTDPERTGRIISRYTLAFFDKHLKGIDQSLLDGPSSDIPEVRFEVWTAKSLVVRPER